MSARLIGRAAGVIHCYHKRRRARTLAPVSAYGGGASVQIGVDIGGTFTDIVALGDDGRLHLTKVPTTPKDLLVL